MLQYNYFIAIYFSCSKQNIGFSDSGYVIKSSNLHNPAPLCMELRLFHLGKVSPTFPAALFSVDERFARNIERPQTGIK